MINDQGVVLIKCSFKERSIHNGMNDLFGGVRFFKSKCKNRRLNPNPCTKNSNLKT